MKIIHLDNGRTYTSTQFLLLTDTCIDSNGNAFNKNHKIVGIEEITDEKQINLIEKLMMSARLENDETTIYKPSILAKVVFIKEGHKIVVGKMLNEKKVLCYAEETGRQYIKEVKREDFVADSFETLEAYLERNNKKMIRKFKRFAVKLEESQVN